MAKSVLIVDHSDVGGALALRAAQNGWMVFWFIEYKPANNQETGTGIHPNIKKIKEWIPYGTKVDIIVTTENGNFLPKLEMFRKRGIPVFAPSQAIADLEINRGEGLKFLEDHGIQVPEYKTFKNFEQAEKYIIQNPKPYVFKTLGDNDNKALTFVGKTPQQLIQRMHEWKATGVVIKGDIMLQEFIKGQEFGVSRWIGKTGPVGPILSTFEHKKLFNDEKGCNTGEMGTVSKYVTEEKLYDLVLAPLVDDLVKMGAFTCIDLNCIIDENGQPWPLEFTSRWGWPQFNLCLEAHSDLDPIQWMLDACNGNDTLTPNMDVTIGVVMTLPPFPHEDKGHTNTDGIPIYGLNDRLKKHIQPQSVRMGKFVDEVDGKFEEVDGWVSSGPYVAVVTETGKTVEDARDKVYKLVDKISMSDLGYRTDIGCKVIKSLPILQKLGFATEWELDE